MCTDRRMAHWRSHQGADDTRLEAQVVQALAVATGMAALPPSPDVVSVASSADARAVPPSEALCALISQRVWRVILCFAHASKPGTEQSATLGMLWRLLYTRLNRGLGNTGIQVVGPSA